MGMGAQEFGDELLRRLLDQAMEMTEGAVGAGLVVGHPAGAAQGRRTGHTPAELRVAAAVGLATVLDPAQVACGEGPVLDAVGKGTVVVMPADGEPPGAAFDLIRYPALVEHADRGAWEGVRGVVVTPGEWGSELPVVLSTYLLAPPTAEVLGQIDRWESLLAAALAVVEYCAGEEMRAEQMLQMIQYRRVVEQAKGMIMAVTGQEAQTAFAVLSRASQHFNVRLRNLAVALVEHVGDGTAEHPDDPEAVIHTTSGERRVAGQVWTAMTRAPAPGRPAAAGRPLDPPR